MISPIVGVFKLCDFCENLMIGIPNDFPPLLVFSRVFTKMDKPDHTDPPNPE